MFSIRDNGDREQFNTGARRDTQEGKPRYDLISPYFLNRLANWLDLGAKKYGERNWEKGIPVHRCVASALRHIYSWIMGDRVEDHLSAVAFNIMAIVHYEEISKDAIGNNTAGVTVDKAITQDPLSLAVPGSANESRGDKVDGVDDPTQSNFGKFYA